MPDTQAEAEVSLSRVSSRASSRLPGTIFIHCALVFFNHYRSWIDEPALHASVILKYYTITAVCLWTLVK
ncbi:MAG: hypothetical protein WCK35_25935 [Chloroflexota bacterium]